jgi:hypothetical protein
VRYFEEARSLLRTAVPARGQAATVQGELVRAVEKLRYEADRGRTLVLRILDSLLKPAACLAMDLLREHLAALDHLIHQPWQLEMLKRIDRGLGDLVVAQASQPVNRLACLGRVAASNWLATYPRSDSFGEVSRSSVITG